MSYVIAWRSGDRLVTKRFETLRIAQTFAKALAKKRFRYFLQKVDSSKRGKLKNLL